MVSYGWTIDYINENVTLAQMRYLMDEIVKNPPTSVLGFSLGNKVNDESILSQLGKFGDKVKYERFSKKSIRSVVRYKDKKRLK